MELPAIRGKRVAVGAWAVLALLLVAQGCAGPRPDNPLVALRAQLNEKPEYAVLLGDMKEERGLFSSRYLHRYQIVSEGQEETLPWMEVPKEVYTRYESLLGMTILSKTPDGEVTETAYPPGYQYVGNPKYGSWQTDSSGRSFWHFYGQYAMFRTLMGMGSRTIYRNDWETYGRRVRTGVPYYGPNREFGTAGTVTKQSKPDFYQRRMARRAPGSESFRNKVDQRVGRSRTAYRSRSSGYGK